MQKNMWLKKIDKLILKALIGPFFLTFLVVDFILLIQLILSYIDDLIGKDIGFVVFGKMIFFFGLSLTPMALPLAILLSCLITFGNLGEHFELTAIKSAGISLIRVLAPIAVVAVLLSGMAFWFNNNVVPYANLQAYSTLYNVRTTKASLDLKEGAFYNGIPNYSIKVGKKYPDGKTLKDLIIYNHSTRSGNKEVIIADSGKMYTIYEGAFLVFELFNGNSYTDYNDRGAQENTQFVRNQYQKSKLVFNLSSFKTNDVQEESFRYHQMMKTVSELSDTLSIMRQRQEESEKAIKREAAAFYTYYSRHWQNDSTERALGVQSKPVQLTKTYLDSMRTLPVSRDFADLALSKATNQARSFKSFLSSRKEIQDNARRQMNQFHIEKVKKYTYAGAVFVMFLIGAPLGAIIKKGGLGVPMLISIVFFILYYIFSITGEKYAKDSIVPVSVGLWAADVILLFVGLFFLRQARNDSRVFDKDIYVIALRKLKALWNKEKN
jgi:lipopolysaccharide export system permease protein